MKKLHAFLPVLLLLLTLSCTVIANADSYPKLEIRNLPDKLVYGLGETLDKTGLKATLWDKGNIGTGYEAADLSVTAPRFSTSGEKTVTVRAQDYDTGKWYSTTFTVYVLPYSRTLQPSDDYPRYTYYGNNVDRTETYSCPGATSLLLQFSNKTEVDACDYIYLYDGNNNLLGEYEGDFLAGKKIWITGSSFSIRLTSDEEDKAYGYSFDAIWAVDAVSCSHLYGEETVTAATCDKDGKRVKECLGCGYVNTTVLPKLTTDGKHTYNYEEDPEETFVSGYTSYYNMYYSCKTCGYQNIASGYPGWSGNDADHGNCGNWLYWALLEDGTMVIYTVYDYQDTYTMWSVPEKASQAKSLYVQNGVTNIYPSAFQEARSLTSVHLPATMQTIGDKAFYNCDSLTEITFPGALTTIGKDAFRNCDKLTSVDFGTSSPTLGEYAFGYCTKLESVDFGTGAVTVGSAAFDNCSAITTLDIPERVTLADYAFHKCTGLETVTVRCKDIPDSCFESCWNLSSVTLKNTEHIGEYAFGGTNNLRSIVFPATLKTIDRAFTAQAGHNPALSSATFLAKDTNLEEHPFPSVSTAQLTIRGPGCSTAAAYAKKYGYTFSSTDNSSHTMLTVPAVTPTCQTEGFTEGISCTACGYVEKKRTSLGMGGHEISEWSSLNADEHSRGCLHCDTQNETVPHERNCGYCSVCKDDSLSYVFLDGTLTLFSSSGGFGDATVLTAVYSESEKLLFLKQETWGNSPVYSLTLPACENAYQVKVFFLSDYMPLRPLLKMPWK